MKRLFIYLLFLLACTLPVLGQSIVKYQGLASQGNVQVTSGGVGSSNRVLGSYPLCTVTVYATGTTTLATLYSDSTLTPKSNPFTATSEGYYEFYIVAGTYDIRFSGTGISTPFTRSAITIVANASGIFINASTYGATPDLVGDVRENEAITATNGSAAITSNARFPSRWVSLTNISVTLNSVSYTISSCASTSACTLSANYSGTTSTYVDLVATLTASVTGSSTSITCAKCYFTTARDVGKKVVLSGVSGAAATVTTISSVTSTTVAVLAAAPPTTGTVNIWFGTDNTTALNAAMTACDAAGGGTVYVPVGKYLLNYTTIPRRTTFLGAGKQVTQLLSYASSGGIIRSTWPSNASTGAYTKLTGFLIRALDTNSTQHGFVDNGGTYVEVYDNSFEGAHHSITFDQTEISEIYRNNIVSYQPTYQGLMSGRLDPATSGSWTKTGAATTGTDSGLWLVNTSANITSYYSKALALGAFYKGFVLQLSKGVSVASAENASFDDAKLYRVDDGVYKYDLQVTSTQIRLNGGTARAFTTSQNLRLEVDPFGATADLYIDGILTDSNVAAAATSGSALVGFGDFTTTDDAVVYYGPLVYYSAAKMPTGIWLVSGDDVTVGNSGLYTNIINVHDNQINGNFTHIADDGGTDHIISHNNCNGGLWSFALTATVNLSINHNAHESHQWEALIATGFQIQGGAGGALVGTKIEINTYNNSVISSLPPVKFISGDIFYLDTNIFTKAPAQGYCIEVDQAGAGRVVADHESLPSAPDSLFNTTAISITSNVNNYDLGALDIVYVTTDASRTITGISDGKDRRSVIIHNTGSNDLVLAHQSASSTAANRVITFAALDIAVVPGGAAQIIYDPAALRWRAILLQ